MVESCWVSKLKNFELQSVIKSSAILYNGQIESSNVEKSHDIVYF